MSTITKYRVMEVGIPVFWPDEFESTEAAQAAIDAHPTPDEFQIATVSYADPGPLWDAVLAKRAAAQVSVMTLDEKATKLAELKAMLAALESQEG